VTLPNLIPKLMPNAYYPDVFEIQLRMDAPASDVLAHLELTNNAHAEIIERLLAFKNNYPLFFETTEESSRHNSGIYQLNFPVIASQKVEISSTVKTGDKSYT